MIQIYGSLLCPDCVACKEAFDEEGVAYIFRDFSEELPALKEFLTIRDREQIFDDVRKNGKIGIPCLVLADGSVSLDWEGCLHRLIK